MRLKPNTIVYNWLPTQKSCILETFKSTANYKPDLLDIHIRNQKKSLQYKAATWLTEIITQTEDHECNTPESWMDGFNNAAYRSLNLESNRENRGIATLRHLALKNSRALLVAGTELSYKRYWICQVLSLIIAYLNLNGSKEGRAVPPRRSKVVGKSRVQALLIDSVEIHVLAIIPSTLCPLKKGKLPEMRR